ncbi:alanine--tRNA ligase [Candidatus Phytoplasma oryzae]|nr:alanine--tRNA ligase [Candidatus Phytoplasma oryzae]
MKKLTSNQIRQMWINFFIRKNHHKENSFSLIPKYDPTLLWINAGVAPLKKYLNGTEKPPFKRIVNIQKCLRTNDIEKIGNTSIHHTFFEMLGNFSIGDYFKKEAIDFAYELLISHEWFNIPKERLYITYFEHDKETYSFWLKKGIDKLNLISLRTNFWQIGEGPCGPCTEIFFDRGSKYDHRGKELIYEEITNNRFIEIWNIVFSQFNCEEHLKKDEYKPLPSKNIDTGAGLERLACIFQQTDTNFETDLFFPIIQKISFLSNCEYKGQKFFKIIADHIKSLVFCINDGAIFSNLGRGYILKRILRKAFQSGKKIGFSEPFLFKLVGSVIDIMNDFYPDLNKKKNLIEKMIKEEEKKFLFHLNNGEKIFDKIIKNNELSGENFFKLYDTFGLPQENILEYARNKKIKVDLERFNFFLQKQKDLSRNFNKNDINYSIKNKDFLFLNFKTKSEFVGYEEYEIQTQIIKVFDKGIVLKKTPFYATSGGQLSDEGLINDIYIKEVNKLPNGQFFHKIQNTDIFKKGQKVLAKIDIEKRQKTSSNHTATHLLIESLKKKIGQHVQQQGSWLNNEMLRFDFNHYENLSFEKIIEIEDQVNIWIHKDYSVTTHTILLKDLDKINDFFENEYFVKKKENLDQNLVRIVKINNISSQLCGGTHVKNTKLLKKFAIYSYEVIGSGIYRIEATTGENTSLFLAQKIKSLSIEENQILNKINKMKDFIFSQKNFFTEKISKFFDQNFLFVNNDNDSYRCIHNYKKYLIFLRKKLLILQKEFNYLKTKIILARANEFIPSKNEIQKELLIFIKDEKNDTNNIDNYMLQVLLEHLFDKLNVNFLCLCKKREDKLFFICKSKFLSINNFIKKLKTKINIKGGGNNHFGQGIITNINQIDEFLFNWRNFLHEN